MFGWNRERRARKQARQVKPGDGSSLKPYRWWHMVYRSLFSVQLAGPQGSDVRYEVDVDLLDFDERAYLYADGRQSAVSTVPAVFPVPGGRIEVATTLYGIKRMHLVRDDGAERQLTPDPYSGEGRRAELDRRHPVVSKIIGLAAVVILLVSLVIVVPALIELLTQWEFVADHVGTFTSPFDLPPWAGTALAVAAVMAAVERALMLRNHWLIDMESGWLDD